MDRLSALDAEFLHLEDGITHMHIAGMIVFSEYPSTTTMIGGFVIFLSTTWIARREARRRT